MNKLIRVVPVLFLIAGCTHDRNTTDSIEPVGTLRLNIEQQAGTSLPDSLSLQVKATGGNVVAEYAHLSEFPSSGLSIAPDTYVVSAIPFNKKVALFEKPIYAGSASTTVSLNSTSNVSLTLRQANFAVAIAYSDKFKAENKDYAATIQSPNGTLSYPGTESRFGYFYSGPLTVTITYTDSKNVKQTSTHTIAENSPSIAPASKLTLTVKLPNESGSGGDETYEGYYQDATGKTGIELKKTLTRIISTGYKEQSYNALWDAYKKGDIRTDGTGAIWDMYSDNPNGPEPYLFQPGQDQCGNYSGEGSCYNREHSVPKSWFNDAKPMYSDYIHLVPTDGYVNSKRSNDPLGEVGTPKWTSKNGSKSGPARAGLGINATVFEPIDEYKGDFARIYFYFVTRYASRIASWDNNVFSSDDLGLDRWTINMFLRWSKNDPVSEKERVRNNVAQEFQGNRNPYVDHPEFIEKIWGTSTTATSTKASGGVAVTYSYTISQ